MAEALREAERLGLDCVQVFTKNQQQWKAPPLKPEAIAEWAGELRRLGWASEPGQPVRTVSHASYLANLASPDDVLRDRSIALMREELDRCHALGIPLLVFHPGAHTLGTRAEGVERIAAACAGLLAATPTHAVTLCLEDVAGAGTTIGRSFEELAELRARVIALASAGKPTPARDAAAARVGFCLDTCHLHAAGYDLSTRGTAEAALAEADRVIGLAHVRVLHVNDSKGGPGSRLDRHEHIGKGTIGRAGFAAVVNHPAFAAVPKIMETPKGDGPRGTAWDVLNVRVLRGLVDQGPGGGGVKTPSRRRAASARANARTQPRPKRRPPRAAG